ncbi:hypothetical protein [Rhodopseudomonas sp. B29]|uniref:hypothetical protein n=1 Tax=Rhodopseudomonas sp. B29 TaxID=95607 RepID=UPI00034621CB|nr:hypothetical protein [Rhodopseudomonas sp. B29]
MPATSPEAIARKNKRKRDRRAAKKAERLAAVVVRNPNVSRTDPVYRGNLPKLDLQLDTADRRRDFLAEAVRNTAGARACR